MTAIHRGATISDIQLIDEHEAELFNFYADEFCDELAITDEVIDHAARQNNWNYPTEFDEFNLHDFFLGMCKTDIERERVTYELQLFEDRKLNKLLRWAVWFMTFVNTNNIFIGVGRGSSVSSYCLYLIGLHMVNSIECGLDPHEFLK